ncbi:long-chain-fatty-acid--CoA ligase [Pseudomonas sp. TTU2014-080ASC]|uniref:long-chain-fatty-acid--CoA ligase n=1 Tax=Pseudomonas sp. TTU2014-080ASC TaxID=1729724 RepID=UPI000718562F|nr:long-chain fatty acid--CoA ligase [Pseudomonas sp. TTU2014-080ASC]KRW62665.1 AMP-dependent synthetase [Pseudomonas sp. TTU2014-080ASC]
MQAPWINAYPEGVRWDTALPPRNLLQDLDQAVATWPQRPALDFMGRKLSYLELCELINKAAKGLQALGVKPGVHVGLFLPNVPHYIISFFAILRAGGCVVNYSPLDAGCVLEHKIEDSQTDILLTLDLQALYPKMAELLQHTRLQKLIVGSLGEYSAAPEQIQQGLRQQGQLADVSYNADILSFAALLDNEGDYQTYPIDDPTSALAVLQYTGGTTGLPKGAMLSHANLTAATSMCALTSVDNDQLLHVGKERVLTVLPLFHVYAMVVEMLLSVRIGAEIVLMVKFDPEAVFNEIHTGRISLFPGVPTMFTALSSHPRISEFTLDSLKICVSGGAPLPVELVSRFKGQTGCRITEGWGMTETCSTGTFTPVFSQPRPGSCGIPAPNVTISLRDLDDSSREVPAGQPGEICIASPSVMLGYWNKPEANAESFTADGFLRTGDVGHMDQDGYLYIVDRTKDMLLCSGFNVYPRVIEEAIYAHPAVEEVMVIGIPDEYRGQSPKAYMKLRDSHAPFALEELQHFLKDRLGKHEMVQAIEFRETLPKTPVGKLSKKMLHDELNA